MQNTAKIINRFPSLSIKLQIVILKLSSSFINNSAVHQKYAKTFWVLRKNVKIWLHFLVKNHPDYKNVVIDEERISFFLGNNTVIKDFSIVLHDEVNVDKHDDNMKEEAMTNEAIINETMINITTINKPMIHKSTINEPTINEPTIDKSTIDKAMVKKAIINETMVSETTMANESRVNKAITTNKAKNNVGMCDEYVHGGMQCKRAKKEKNTFIQEVNLLGTLNLTLKLDRY